MHYDPIKNILARLVKRNPLLRKIFYKLLGLMFLREWYVKKRIKRLKNSKNERLNSILDAGSGFGQYTYFMAKRFPHAMILSVDVKEDQIEDCRYFFSRIGLNNCEFAVKDLTKMEFKDKFDFVLSVDVMEHIEDDEEVLSRFYAALKPGGRVMINTPSNLGGSGVKPEGILRSAQNDKGLVSFIGEHVRTGYSKEEICVKLERTGFEISSFEYTYGKWGRLYWKLGIKIPMLMLNKSQVFFLVLPFYYLLTIWFVWLFMILDVNEKGKKEGTGILVTAIKN